MLVDYVVLTTPPTNANGKTVYVNNDKARNSILYGISQYKLVKFIHCKSVKDVWEKFNKIHEGYEKVKQAKLQTFVMRFESLRMNGEEIISKYFIRFDEVINMIRGLGEDVKEEVVIQKIWRSLLMRFHAKISTIEEMKNLKNGLVSWYSHSL